VNAKNLFALFGQLAIVTGGSMGLGIVSGGENLSSLDVEKVLVSHPDVYEAAVIPVPDKKLGEVPRAVVVVKQGRKLSETELIEFYLVNEGARILEEGWALRAVDIDIIYLNGYGFPAYRGGPMWYADIVGLRKVYERICEFHQEHGDLWEPAPLLRRLAETRKTFADFDSENANRQ
jgi:acyl-CoA synthetase (AMP-forming)/AMP-acid ligase II